MKKRKKENHLNLKITFIVASLFILIGFTALGYGIGCLVERTLPVSFIGIGFGCFIVGVITIKQFFSEDSITKEFSGWGKADDSKFQIHTVKCQCTEN